jgi:hypothetical protein
MTGSAPPVVAFGNLEDQRVLRGLHLGLYRVVAVVEANGDDLGGSLE